ncbi:MAG TPA: hypothetical protein VIE65_18685 [Methylobacter sp.]|jgi:hypothetical protein
MDTPEEMEREEWHSKVYDEISSEAIAEFSSELLRSYYLENPLLAKNAFTIFREAKSLAITSPTAALVLYTTAIEVMLKSTVLKPVIYGLVHNVLIADLVSDLVVKNNGIDRFQAILSVILDEYAEIDINTYKIPGHSKTIWEEIKNIQVARNAVMHRAQPALPEMAELAKEVAEIVIIDFLQGIVKNFGLQLQSDGVIVT